MHLFTTVAQHATIVNACIFLISVSHIRVSRHDVKQCKRWTDVTSSGNKGVSPECRPGLELSSDTLVAALCSDGCLRS